MARSKHSVVCVGVGCPFCKEAERIKKEVERIKKEEVHVCITTPPVYKPKAGGTSARLRWGL